MTAILIPSLFIALLTSAWFTLVAGRAGQTRTLWGLSGALLGLVLSALCLGLGQAVRLPISDAQRSRDVTLNIVIAVAIVAIIGAGITVAVSRRSHHRLAA